MSIGLSQNYLNWKPSSWKQIPHYSCIYYCFAFNIFIVSHFKKKKKLSLAWICINRVSFMPFGVSCMLLPRSVFIDMYKKLMTWGQDWSQYHVHGIHLACSRGAYIGLVASSICWRNCIDRSQYIWQLCIRGQKLFSSAWVPLSFLGSSCDH